MNKTWQKSHFSVNKCTEVERVQLKLYINLHLYIKKMYSIGLQNVVELKYKSDNFIKTQVKYMHLNSEYGT